MAWEDAAEGKRHQWRYILIAAGSVAAALFVGLLVFSWLSSLPATRGVAMAGSEERPGMRLGIPHIHVRF